MLLTLGVLNLVLYGWLPPAQPMPDIPHGERARRAAESAGTLAAFYDFDDLRGTGWYAPEPPDGLDGAVFRYMAEPSAFVPLTVGCGAPWTVEVMLIDRPITLFSPDITLRIDGRAVTLARSTAFRRVRYVAERVEGLAAGDWALTLTSSELYRPSEAFATGEARLLGAAVDWVLVTGTGCGDGAVDG